MATGMNMSPVNVLDRDATEEKGENARLASFVGAIAIADLVKTTLGPKGMDKILQSVTSREGTVVVTNDGATILKSLFLDNPAAKALVEVAKTQDDEVGDGTTSVTVLCGELLREAEKLVNQKIHPQVIIDGFRMATQVAKEALIKSSSTNASNPDKFRDDLFNIARTTLSSKILKQEREYFAKMCVDAVLRIKSTNLDSIHIIKKVGGSLRDSFLDDGFIIEKTFGVNQKKRWDNPKILIANTPMDTDKIKIFGAVIKVDSTAKVAEIEQAEQEKMKQKCTKIAKHGVNVFINRQLIYNLPEQYFTENGMSSVEHADFEGIERLALALGAEIVSTFDHPELVQLGTCKLMEEIMIGEDSAIRFSGLPKGEACTIVLRGGTSHMLDEAERSLHDALCVLTQTTKETRTIYGGGCTEILMAQAVDELANKTSGKRALAIEAFARALRAIPAILAENGGFDASELVSQLRSEHYNGNHKAGLDLRTGVIGNMQELSILESFKVKVCVLQSASEAAEMILRVDDVVKAAPRRREQ